MLGRGLRSDIRRDTYARICDADPIGARNALALQRAPHALTVSEALERERKRPCRIFRGSGDVCERPTCQHARARHQFVWRKQRVLAA